MSLAGIQPFSIIRRTSRGSDWMSFDLGTKIPLSMRSQLRAGGRSGIRDLCDT